MLSKALKIKYGGRICDNAAIAQPGRCPLSKGQPKALAW
jgi:hypothetical protein